jgi:hypothetical protein
MIEDVGHPTGIGVDYIDIDGMDVFRMTFSILYLCCSPFVTVNDIGLRSVSNIAVNPPVGGPTLLGSARRRHANKGPPYDRTLCEGVRWKGPIQVKTVTLGSRYHSEMSVA